MAFHDDGRVCAIGGWDGRCVPPTPLMFLMIDLSADGRVSFAFKKTCCYQKKKTYDAKP